MPKIFLVRKPPLLAWLLELLADPFGRLELLEDFEGLSAT